MNDIRIQARHNGKESTMLKVRTLFSGIGAPESALEKLGVDFEIVDFCEIDKYAVKSYCAVHGVDESKNLGDISTVDTTNLPYADLLVWGFPCQDISVAGKQRGIQEGETRSGLYYEGFRILRETRPKYSIIENVKNLVGKKFKADFESMLDDIESIGYNNYWKVLNAKDYGIPQNRERVFIVSIRKDVDTGGFGFPEGFDNGLRLKDFLEDEVDEKFYISQEKTEKLIKSLNGKGLVGPGINVSRKGEQFESETDTAMCLLARDYKGFGTQQMTGVCIPCITPDREEKRQNGRKFKEDGDPMFTLTGQDRHGVLQVGNIVDAGNWNNPQRGRIYSAEGCSPALNTVGGGGLEPKILIDDTWSEKFGGTKTYRDYCPTLRSERYGLKVAVKEATKRDHIDSPLNFQNCPDYSGCEFAMMCERSNNCIMQESDGHPKVAVKEATKLGYAEATKLGYAEATIGDSINIQFPNSDTRRGRVGHEVAQTLETSCNQATLTHDYRVRKLTPKECWRLMGFTDEEFQKAQDAGVSNSQLYKQAGNSIVVDVLEYIFRNLLK